MTRPETALAQIATVAQTAIRAATPDGTGFAWYPAPGSISGNPNLLLFWSETSVAHGSEQVWTVAVKGQLLVAQRNKLSTDIAKADPLIVPIVDAFAADTAGFTLTTPANGRLVDFCQVERIVPSLVIEFPGGSGATYYGAEVYWRMKIRRFAGET